MTDELDDILDDLFHGCAFAAFVELAVERGTLPGEEETRRRAFAYYEHELAARDRARGLPFGARPEAAGPAD
ncbi:hypothetical protein AB1L88_16720 [Tautonia sp. JC769]|uniref:hypothetical protein n=1 Tax=Tautonia sp. JC769 TaxID=3232135 RepID=UPI00345A4D11